MSCFDKPKKKISRCSVLIVTLMSVKVKVGVAHWRHFTGTECFGKLNLFGTVPLFIYPCGALQEFETAIDSSKSPLTDGLISFNRWRHWFSVFNVSDFYQHLLNSATQEIQRKEIWYIHEILNKVLLFWRLSAGLDSCVTANSIKWWALPVAF